MTFRMRVLRREPAALCTPRSPRGIPLWDGCGNVPREDERSDGRPRSSSRICDEIYRGFIVPSYHPCLENDPSQIDCVVTPSPSPPPPHLCKKHLPLGESVTAGMECMLGSAMYLKSTGMSLHRKRRQSAMKSKANLPRSFK